MIAAQVRVGRLQRRSSSNCLSGSKGCKANHFKNYLSRVKLPESLSGALKQKIMNVLNVLETDERCSETVSPTRFER